MLVDQSRGGPEWLVRERMTDPSPVASGISRRLCIEFSTQPLASPLLLGFDAAETPEERSDGDLFFLWTLSRSERELPGILPASLAGEPQGLVAAIEVGAPTLYLLAAQLAASRALGGGKGIWRRLPDFFCRNRMC